MLAGTFHGGDVAAVPHPRPAQLAQVVQAARDPRQQAELVEEAAGLEAEGRKRGLQSGEKGCVLGGVAPQIRRLRKQTLRLRGAGWKNPKSADCKACKHGATVCRCSMHKHEDAGSATGSRIINSQRAI